MKTREPRRSAFIQARMRLGASWSDAYILNFSSRGLLLQAERAPTRGSYLEVRRGSHVIVARVVWARNRQFGVQTQEPVPADDILNIAGKPAGADAGRNVVERRAARRDCDRSHEQNRWLARTLQFAATLMLGASAAALASTVVGDMLSKPLAAVGAKLGTR